MLAIALRAVSALLVAVMFAAVKWLGEHQVTLGESLFYRQLFALPIVLMLIACRPEQGNLRTMRFRAHLGRTVVGLAAMTLNFLTAMILPLATMTMLGLSVPIFATILSIIFLAERPGSHRLVSIAVGFVGVLVIIHPGLNSSFGVSGILVGLLAAIVTAVVSLLLRQLGSSEAPQTTSFYFSALSLPPLGIAMIFVGQQHEARIWLVLAGMGTAGGLGQVLIAASLRYAPVSVVLPIDYSVLIWSSTLGWLLWHNWPSEPAWLGAAIIVASSSYILHRERYFRQTVHRSDCPITSDRTPD